MADAIKLGTPVTYVSSKGRHKLAFVIGTPETITEGTSAPTLVEGQLHLSVFNLAGGIESKFSVPSAEYAQTIPDFAVAGEEMRNIWLPIS